MRIGDREFDWQPTVGDGVDPTAGLRGTDPRITERSTRARASDRLAARKARRRPAPDLPDYGSNFDTGEDDESITDRKSVSANVGL